MCWICVGHVWKKASRWVDGRNDTPRAMKVKKFKFYVTCPDYIGGAYGLCRAAGRDPQPEKEKFDAKFGLTQS